MSEVKPVGRLIEPGPTYRGVERIAQIRSYSEYSEASLADSNGYWLEGEKVYSQSQVFEMLAAATPPQPIYDQAKERVLFEAYCAKVGLPIDTLPSGEYLIPVTRFVSQGWHARAKAGEDE